MPRTAMSACRALLMVGCALALAATSEAQISSSDECEFVCGDVFSSCSKACFICDPPVPIGMACPDPQVLTCGDYWGCCPDWSCDTEVTGKWQITTTILGFGACLPVTDKRVTCTDPTGCFGTESWCGADYGTPLPVVFGLDCCELGECWGSRCH